MAVSRTGEDLGIDRVPKQLSKTLDLRGEPLVQGTPGMPVRARGAESRRQTPIRQHWRADRFAMSIQGNPHFPEAVQIPAQTKAGARSLEGLGFGCGDRVLSIGPRSPLPTWLPRRWTLTVLVTSTLPVEINFPSHRRRVRFDRVDRV